MVTTALLASSAAVSDRLGGIAWRFAWQSEGNTGEPWIGPDIVDYLETLHAEGVRAVLQVPIGFVADHLEILYDIDVAAREEAEEAGLAFNRIELMNTSPAFIRALADVALEQERAGQPAG